MRPWIVAILGTGCWSAPKAAIPPAATPIETGTPGLLWQSPAQPFHTSRTGNAYAFAGNTLLVASERGWISRMDLATGKVTGERQLDAKLPIQAIAALSDNRWFAIGQSEKEMKTWVIDGRSLDAELVDLHPDDSHVYYGNAGIAVLGDGGLVITGRGLPLAIYDPQTFAVRDTLDPELGWSSPRAAGKIVLADRSYRGHRFDLATTPVSRGQLATRSEITETATIEIRRRDGVQVASRIAGNDHVDYPEAIEQVIAGPGETVITTLKSQIQVRASTDGKILRRIELGPSAMGKSVSRPVFDASGKRAIVEVGSIIRVIDLVTGSISSEGAPPFGRDNRIAIDNDGRVLVPGNAFGWQLSTGKVVASVAYEEAVHRTSHLRGTTSSVVLVKDKHVEQREVGTHRALASWDLAEEAYDVWFGRDGTPVFDVLSDDGPLTKAVVVRDGTATDFVRYNPDGALWDVDVDTEEALVVLRGRVGLAIKGVPSSIELRVPSCEDTSEAHLEHDGKRAITVGTREIAVWDRTTGALVAAAKMTSPIRDQAFVTGRQEIVIATDEALGVWSPRGDLREVRVPGIVHVGVSPDGKRVAASFNDGHVAVFELASLFARPLATPPGLANVPTSCNDDVGPFDEGYHDCEDCGEFD